MNYIFIPRIKRGRKDGDIRDCMQILFDFYGEIALLFIELFTFLDLSFLFVMCSSC
jgi:hypothetical protein